MSKKKPRQLSVNDLLDELFKPVLGLRDLFNQRLEELEITATAARDIMEIQHRTLNGILDGTQKIVDYTNFIKLSDFLQISTEQVVSLYLVELKRNFTISSPINPQKVKFIKENFDLSALKKANVIQNISDYEDIEVKLCSLLGIKSIFEYQVSHKEAAFSSGKIKPKNELTRSLWISRAKGIFEEIDNPYEYNQQSLIDYFPEIRWHSTNVEHGLKNVIRSLYKIGVTVIYQPSLPSIHLRGATFAVNSKPSVVLTDYRGFYATLWFALIHELFHVLFDWDEILEKRYHLSDNSEELSVIDKENEANSFARAYLFSQEKTNIVRNRITDTSYVAEFAKVNQVHPSLIYTFYAYDCNSNASAWERAHRENPDFSKLTEPFGNDWKDSISIKEYVKSVRNKYYN